MAVFTAFPSRSNIFPPFESRLALVLVFFVCFFFFLVLVLINRYSINDNVLFQSIQFQRTCRFLLSRLILLLIGELVPSGTNCLHHFSRTLAIVQHVKVTICTGQTPIKLSTYYR